MNIWQRWKQTALHNKALVLSSVLMAFGTVFYSGAAVVQILMFERSSQQASDQTDKLIVAANKIQGAAERFSGSAGGINTGVSEAVGKLNDQATQLGKNVTETGRLADETKKANTNVTASDRPWIGGSIAVANFDVGKKVSVTITYINSGKRPAVVDFTGVHSDYYVIFPPNPRDQYLTGQALKESPSKSVLVPGQSTQMSYTSEHPITQPEWDLVIGESGAKYLIFSTAEYRDLVTNEPHYTRMCVRFYPASKSPTDTGFRNCQEYNDAN